MALEHRQTMTVEEYFHLEENDPDTRYEYIDGHVYAMAGGTANHDTVKSNIQRILWNLLQCKRFNLHASLWKSLAITKSRISGSTKPLKILTLLRCTA